jgi:hypothetical protein
LDDNDDSDWVWSVHLDNPKATSESGAIVANTLRRLKSLAFCR